MPKRKNTSTFVTHAECAEVSGQIRNEISVVKKALVGADLRGGLVKDVADMKSDMETIKKFIDNQKTKGRDWRLLGFSILGSIVSGTVIAVLYYILRLFG